MQERFLSTPLAEKLPKILIRWEQLRLKDEFLKAMKEAETELSDSEITEFLKTLEENSEESDSSSSSSSESDTTQLSKERGRRISCFDH